MRSFTQVISPICERLYIPCLVTKRCQQGHARYINALTIRRDHGHTTSNICPPQPPGRRYWIHDDHLTLNSQSQASLLDSRWPPDQAEPITRRRGEAGDITHWYQGRLPPSPGGQGDQSGVSWHGCAPPGRPGQGDWPVLGGGSPFCWTLRKEN